MDLVATAEEGPHNLINIDGWFACKMPVNEYPQDESVGQVLPGTTKSKVPPI
jgi:hypothetical protein